jgi:flagellar basal body-associated protein FliL
MSENRRKRRKNKEKDKVKPKNNTITKRDKIYGIIAMVVIFLAALAAAIYVSW